MIEELFIYLSPPLFVLIGIISGSHNFRGALLGDSVFSLIILLFLMWHKLWRKDGRSTETLDSEDGDSEV